MMLIVILAVATIYQTNDTIAVTITPAGQSEPHPAANASRFGRKILWISSLLEAVATMTSPSTVDQAVSQQRVTLRITRRSVSVLSEGTLMSCYVIDVCKHSRGNGKAKVAYYVTLFTATSKKYDLVHHNFINFLINMQSVTSFQRRARELARTATTTT